MALVSVSAANISVIAKNKVFHKLIKTDPSRLSNDAESTLQLLAFRSLGASSWLVLQAIGVTIAETIAIVLVVTNTQACKRATSIAVSDFADACRRVNDS